MKKTFSFLLFFVLILSVEALGFSARNTYRAGLAAFQEKDYYTSRLFFQEILHKEPLGEFGDDAQYYVALTWFYEGKYDNAIFELSLLERDYPNSEYITKGKFFIAESYYYKKNYEKALQLHHNFVREYPLHPFAPNALFSAGYIYMEQRRFDEAISDFSLILEKYSNSEAAGKATLQRGIAYYNLKDYKNARRDFQNLLQTKESVAVDASFWLGRCDYAEEDYATAKTKFLRTAKDYPDTAIAPEALYYAALSAAQLKQMDEALNVLLKAESKYSQYKNIADIWYRIAVILRDKGEKNRSAQYFEKVVGKKENDELYIEALNSLAEIREEQGESEKAKVLYEEALKSAGTPQMEVPILAARGALNYRLEKYEDSAKDYTEAYEKEKENPEQKVEYMYLAAQSWYRGGLLDKARVTLNEIDKKYPSSSWRADAYYLRGEIEYAVAEYSKAIQQYQKVLRFYKGSRREFDSGMGVGWSYFELKQYARASDQFRVMLDEAKTPDEKVRARMAFASAEYNLQRYDKSLEQYDIVIKQKESFPDEAEEALFQKSWIYYRSREYDKAAGLFAEYRNSYPQGKRVVEAQYFQAWAHYRAGETKIARSMIEILVESEVTNPGFHARALIDLARMQMAESDYPSATATLQKYLSLYPGGSDSEEVYYSLARAYIALSRLDEAWQTYETLSQKNKDSSYRLEVLRDIAAEYRRQKNYNKAEEVYNKMASISSEAGKFELQLSRAELFEESGEKDQAEKTYLSLLSSGDGSALPFKAQALLQLSELYFSSAQYEKIPELGRKYSSTLEDPYLKGQFTILNARSLIELGKYDEAIALLSGLKKDQSFSVEARYYLAGLYEKKSMQVQAKDYYLQVASSDHRLALDATFAVGKIFYGEKEYDNALREFSRIVYTASDHPKIHEESIYYAVLSLRALEREQEAKRFLDKLSSDYPQSSFLEKLQQ